MPQYIKLELGVLGHYQQKYFLVNSPFCYKYQSILRKADSTIPDQKPYKGTQKKKLNTTDTIQMTN